MNGLNSKKTSNAGLQHKQKNKIGPYLEKGLKGLYRTIGVILLSVGVYFFKIPNDFSTGGVCGIATIFGKILPVMSASVWIITINAVLLILGFIFLGKKTIINTVYCSLAYSVLTWIFEVCFPLKGPLTDQPVLELAYAMLLTSLGVAIMFETDASSGGTDIVALILKKYTRINVGAALLCSDFIIATSAFWVFGVKAGMFSLLGLFTHAFLIDSIVELINSCKYFIVITNQSQKVSDYIMHELHHGLTTHEAVGGFSKDRKTIIHTVCRRIEAIRLRKRVFEIDPHAFVIITSSSEIIGRGFRGI